MSTGRLGGSAGCHNLVMTRGIRNAHIAFVIVMAVFALGWVVGLIEGRLSAAVAAIPLFVSLAVAVRAYRSDPARFHEPMTGREIVRAVLPVAVVLLVLVGLTAAAVIVH